MAYFITLEVATILLAFLINLVVFYFVIKFFNRAVTISGALKPILIYEFGFFIFWLIDPINLIYTYFIPFGIRLGARMVLYPLYCLISIAILFLFFRFIMRKFSLLDFKKILISFLIMFFIVTPFLPYGRVVLVSSVTKSLISPDVISELSVLSEMNQVLSFQAVPLSAKVIRVLGILDDSLLGGKFFRELRIFIMTI